MSAPNLKEVTDKLQLSLKKLEESLPVDGDFSLVSSDGKHFGVDTHALCWSR